MTNNDKTETETPDHEMVEALEASDGEPQPEFREDKFTVTELPTVHATIEEAEAAAAERDAWLSEGRDGGRTARGSRNPETDLTGALNHHQGWSERTRTQVREEVARVGGVAFLKNVHGFWDSVQVFDASGTLVADLMKTQVRFRPGFAPLAAVDRGSKDGWLVLSLDGVERAGGGERTARREPIENPTCPRCNLAHAGDECW